MKRLILLRHAKSSWDDDSLADHERPLSPRGRDDAPEMGRRLARLGVAPDLLLTSSARRARATAERIAAELPPDRRRIVLEPALYLASPGEMLAVIAGVDDACTELLLVAHNPGLTRLGNMLVPALRLSNLPTAGVIGIACATDSWAGIDAARFELLYYDFPKNRRASDP